MKKRRMSIVSGLLAGLLTSLMLAAPADALSYPFPDTEDPLAAPSALLLYQGVTPEQDTVVFEQNADTPYQPGALIRVAFGAYAMECIEQQGLDIDTATGTYTLRLFNHYVAGTGLSTASMALEETWTLRDLLSVSMLQTAADAAVTLAATLSGSVEAFVEGMNALAARLGCENTHFANVTGLDDSQMMTTARDVYKLTRHAASYPKLKAIMGLSFYRVTPVSGGQPRGWENTLSLLRDSSEYAYSPTQYGRTGTGGPQNLQCGVAVAAQGGYEYMAIVMGVPREGADGKTGLYFKELKRLLKWGFDGFTFKTLLSKNEILDKIPVSLAWNVDTVALVTAKDFTAIVANGVETSVIRREIIRYEETLTAPVTKGKVLGKVELYLNLDEKIGEVELVAGQTIERSQALYIWETKVLRVLKSPWLWIGVGAGILLIVGYILLNIVHNRRRRHNRMKQVKRYK